MIKRKLKPCITCEQPSYIFSKGCCKSCWQKIYGRRIPLESEKTKKRRYQYQWLRDEYFKRHPICERCGSKHHLDLHHKRGRDGKNLHRDFMTVCRDCHEWIHTNVLESYKMGWLLSRLIDWDDQEETNAADSSP